ncbi:FtsK/SpoIIIE domain-containing protein [Streptomyces sp. NPDC059193]|uniref:FtsK/SpoIIIE domain-containing protein n=1 Tax=Streptomyces sp. NPDC059193 TaxID=3346763 RepID=UPI003690A7C8
MQIHSVRLAPMLDAISAKVAPVKTFTSATRAHGVNVLDALSPTFAPLAARWDAEADRRHALRTPENLKKLMVAQRENTSARATSAQAKNQRMAARKASKNPFAGARRAARTADVAARSHRKAAHSKLKDARTDYPSTLNSVAVRAHAVHVVPAGFASWLMSTPADWATWPASVSAALIAANAGALWLGRRTLSVQVDDEASAEERRLLERLNPTHWVQHAQERGLSGTLTENPELTPAGIVCGVRLDGQWNAKKLAAEADSVRALLGMKTETRMQISRGSHGDRALIVIRTRSASDGVSMIWTPDHEGIGVDEVTGEYVDLPLKPGTHILLAGRTGMGKSVSWRPLAMRAVMAEDWTAVVIDPKRQEAIGWQHALRTVGQETDREERMARIYAMVKELTREMHRRQGMATGSVWIPDGRPENRNLLAIIDEGAAIVRMSKDKRYKDVLDLLEELWAESRSVGFQFVWATQFPTKAVGVPAAVKENMSAFLSLTVNPGEAERAIFGETAQQAGWLPSRLDGIPGRAMLQFQARGSDPLRLWHVTDGMVASVPKADPWRSPAVPTVPAPDGPRLQLVKPGAPEVPAAGAEAAAPASNRDRVLHAVRDGARTNRDVVDRTGINKGSVSKLVKALLESGELIKDADAGLVVGTPGAEGVSA